MPAPKLLRRAVLLRLLWGLPGFAVIGLSLGSHRLPMLMLLLLAQSLLLTAGRQWPEPGRPWRPLRPLLQASLVQFGLLSAYTALLWSLLSWPLARFDRHPGGWNGLLLTAAAWLAWAALWRCWPIFGLVEPSLVSEPARASRPGWLQASRCRWRQARALSTHARAISQSLPATLALLLGQLTALRLSGVPPIANQAATVWQILGYGLLALPLIGWIIASRCRQAVRHPAAPRRHGGGSRRPPPAPASEPPPTVAEPTPAAAAESAVAAASGNPHPEASTQVVEDEDRPTSDGPAPPRPASTPELEAALLAAARAGDVETALQWVAAGAAADTAPVAGERDRRPALMLAALLPDTRLLRALIAHGADVNRRSGPLQLNPLLAATRDSWHGRAEAVMTLISNGADSRSADHEGNTPLHGAVLSEDLSIPAMLIDAGASPNQLNAAGESPLIAACRAANWPQVRFLLERGARPAPADGVPALLAAAGIAEDDPQGVQLLLKHRASVNAVDNRHRSALLEAASEGHPHIVRTLLQAGAKVDLCDRHGSSALMEAARAGALSVVQLLVEVPADVRLRDHHGRDALTLACQSPHADGELIRLLLAHGAEPAARGRDGLTAIDHAATAGRWNLLGLLDPETPLPANLDHPPTADTAATPASLQHALRQGRWPEVAAIGSELVHWPQSWLAQVYLELAHPGQRMARRWLLSHGLSPEARLAANAEHTPSAAQDVDAPCGRLGRRLHDALLKQLPTSAEAMDDLLLAGASPAGAGLLAQALQHDRRSEPQPHDWLLRCLEAGADPFGPDLQGRTPLHLAAANAQLPLVEALLERGCDPNARDRQRRTPLFAALQHGLAALPLIRLLIRYGADPEAMDSHGETPLGLALELPAIETWLNWPDWPLPGRKLREDDLPAAASAGANKAVEQMLALGFAVDGRDRFGATALIHACGGGQLQLIRQLLEAGADPSLATRQGTTALTAAIRGRRETSLRLLLAHGVDLEARPAGALNALLLAAALGYPELAEILLEAGANIQSVDGQGQNCLHWAARFCFQSSDSLRAHRLLELLLRHGAPPEQADQAGYTPLLLLLGADAAPGSACEASHLASLLPALLDTGSQPDTADQRGVSPLHACAMHALSAPARLLLARGANRHAADRFGRSPAEIAYRLGHLELAYELAGRHAEAMPGVAQTLRQPAE